MSSSPPYTTGQAAEFCHVSQATIVNWIKDGKLNGYTTPGGHYRIPQSDLVSFLQIHQMPIDAALRRSTQPVLLLLSTDPTVRDLVRSVGDNVGFEVSLVTSDYALSAEAAGAQPEAVIIDMNASSDPASLCEWLNQTVEGTTVLVLGDRDDEANPLAANVDIYLPANALPALESKLEVLLQ